MMISGNPKPLSLARSIIAGDATAPVLVLEEDLSFWGGIEPGSGLIIDSHHPQQGQCIAGQLLVIPGIKGSTAGPGALLECLFAGQGPAGLIICQLDISPLIAISVFETLCAQSVPMAEIHPDSSQLMCTGELWHLHVQDTDNLNSAGVCSPVC
jgi:predicted aconitase with swiveling domain